MHELVPKRAYFEERADGGLNCAVGLHLTDGGILEGVAHCICAGGPAGTELSFVISVLLNAVDPVFVSVEVFKAQFKKNILKDQQAGSDADGQPENVDGSIAFLAEDIAPGDLEIVLKHGREFKSCVVMTKKPDTGYVKCDRGIKMMDGHKKACSFLVHKVSRKDAKKRKGAKGNVPLRLFFSLHLCGKLPLRLCVKFQHM